MKKRFLFLFPASFLLAAIIIVTAYLCTYYKAQNADDFFSSEEVKITEENYGYFIDGKGDDVAFVFYPGARVEETAYIPLLGELAERGVDCYLMKMPFRMAIFSVSAADKVVGGDKRWFIGGHSLGGAMAAEYLSSTDKNIEGIVLLASYSAKDLSQSDYRALSVYGDRDGLLDFDKVARGRNYFKSENYAESIVIGGNHSGFGCYGRQRGDRSALISAEQQISFTVAKIINFIGE